MCDLITAVPFIVAHSTPSRAVNTNAVKTVKKTSPAPVSAYASTASTISIPATFASSILDVTNARRTRHGASPLAWNDNLANAAQNWGNNCVFNHSPLQYGENIAAGYTNPDVGALADEWYSWEACKYDYNKPAFSETAGHFSQVVWSGTTQMGCALVSKSDVCPNGVVDPDSGHVYDSMLVCEYNPPGNYNGQFQTQVKPPNPAFSCSTTGKLLN